MEESSCNKMLIELLKYFQLYGMIFFALFSLVLNMSFVLALKVNTMIVKTRVMPINICKYI